MAKLVVMPKLGLTMTEGLVSRWLKAEGDPSRRASPSSRSRPTSSRIR